MTRAARLLLLVAAAIAAAFSLRPRAGAGAGHDPRHLERLERGAGALPLLDPDAFRVRSALPDATARLKAMRGGTLRVVSSADDLASEFRQAALLYATEEELDRALEALRSNGPLPPLPRTPDASLYFRDPEGAYRCDVLPLVDEARARVRASVPDARLSPGEDGGGAREGALLRALLAALTVAAISRHPDRRLLAPVVALAALGLSGLGFDAPSVLAAAIVAGAPPGLGLLGGAVSLIFPSLALRRIGWILLLGGAFRLAPARGPAALRLLPAPLLLLATLVPGLLRDGESARKEPIVAIVAKERLAERAASLRALDAGEVVGDEAFEPPPPAPVARAKIRSIYRAAEARARAGGDPAAAAWREAASMESVPLFTDLRARLEAAEGRRALWVPAPTRMGAFLGEPDLYGRGLADLAGARQLAKESAIAAAAAGALGILLVGASRAPPRLAALLFGTLVSALLGAGASPLVAAAAFSHPLPAAPALAVAAIFLPGADRAQAIGAIAAILVTWGLERRSRSPLPPLPSAPAPPP